MAIDNLTCLWYLSLIVTVTGRLPNVAALISSMHNYNFSIHLLSKRESLSIHCQSVNLIAFLLEEVKHYTGDLGGVSGGDAICLSLAKAAGLTGIYKAWLSDSLGPPPYHSPSATFTRSKGPYKLLDGRVAANDWNSLVTRSLLTAINITEKGTIANDPGTGTDLVWTHTTIKGESGITIFTCCNNWLESRESSNSCGDVGFYSQTNSSWTKYGCQTCDTKARIYCFEQ